MTLAEFAAMDRAGAIDEIVRELGHDLAGGKWMGLLRTLIIKWDWLPGADAGAYRNSLGLEVFVTLLQAKWRERLELEAGDRDFIDAMGLLSRRFARR